jgi:hypothetical protein
VDVQEEILHIESELKADIVAKETQTRDAEDDCSGKAG